MTEHEEFNLLCEFMDAFEPLVEPRAAAPLDEKDRELLLRIARGESSQSERDLALPLLTGNSLALEFLAHQMAN